LGGDCLLRRRSHGGRLFAVLPDAGDGRQRQPDAFTLLIAPVAIVLGAIVLGEALPLRAYSGFVILGLGLLILDGRLLKLLQDRTRRT